MSEVLGRLRCRQFGGVVGDRLTKQERKCERCVLVVSSLSKGEEEGVTGDGVTWAVEEDVFDRVVRWTW